MTCDTFRPALVAYHFGTMEEETRGPLEAHLMSCSACVREFVTLKREIELSEEGVRPSAAARTRLRQAVRAELGQGRRPWAWWERPLAVGFATAAVLFAVFVVQTLKTAPRDTPRVQVTPTGRP